MLVTTALCQRALSAVQVVLLYPWRWEEESEFAQFKGATLPNRQQLLRSKAPALVAQEVYGLLIEHYLTRREMARAAEAARVEAKRLSFKRNLEVLEDWMRDSGGGDWLAGLRREVGRLRLRPKRPRSYPRVKKGDRCRWPNKKPGTKPPPQPTKPFVKVMRILQTDGH